MKPNKFLHKPLTDSTNLATTVCTYSTSPYTHDVKVEEVRVHASEAITETVTITLDSIAGTNYDTVLVNKGLVGEQDLVFRPKDEVYLAPGDILKVAVTRANITGTVYLTIQLSS